jgi:hypothetical protein
MKVTTDIGLSHDYSKSSCWRLMSPGMLNSEYALADRRNFPAQFEFAQL